MIIIIFLFLGLVLCNVSAHINAPDDETDEDQTPSPYTFRFATDLALQNESLLNIYLHQYPGDKGVLITPDNKEDVAYQLKMKSIVYVMFNGHPTSDSIQPFTDLSTVLLEQTDANLICIHVDWTKHQITFVDALALAPSFGLYIGTTLNSYKVPTESYHFIAHCVGAEVAAYVADRLFELNHVKIPRLTVFDPYLTNYTRMNDAHEVVEFTDVYHSGIYDPPFPPVGTIDFYPNAGVEQPGCESGSRLQSFICHHRRSIYLYAESVYTKVNAIEAHYHEYERNLHVLSEPRIAPFGHMVDMISGGAFYLPTDGEPPYLVDYF